MQKKLNYRLGIDLNPTSIGWCLIESDNSNGLGSTVAAGVRVFPDGRDAKSNEPLCVSRRTHRGIRRNRDRYLIRRKQLMACLIENGLMPQDKYQRKELEKFDPYQLRTRALDEQLSLYQVGRALFHLNQRRGFKSNRKADSKDEAGAIKSGIQSLNNKISESGYRTLGEYLYRQRRKNKKDSIRFKAESKGNKNVYTLFPERKMYQDEFEKIWCSQARFHPCLTADIKQKISEHIIFFQRNLLPQTVGECTFERGEPRAPLALPIVQKHRVLQEVNNLDLIRYHPEDPKLTADQKDKITATMLFDMKKLNRKGELTFAAIRKMLDLPTKTQFNLESSSRAGLKGDITTFMLSSDKCFGKKWWSFSDDTKNLIINALLLQPDEKEIISWLKKDYALDCETAETISSITLPQGYCRLSLKAIEKIMPYLEQGYIYSDACAMAGYHHSEHRPEDLHNRLSYYGKLLPTRVIKTSLKNCTTTEPQDGDPISLFEQYYGKINNPTVHIALNQLRLLINQTVETYGMPAEIVIELARDLKMNKKEKTKYQSELAKNKRRNEEINAKLKELNVQENYQNRLKYKIWEELHQDPKLRRCPFSGKPISITDIFSPDVEIEHILPFSRTFDDSPANKILAYRYANAYKGNRSPYEAFGHNPQGYIWDEIAARAESLPDNKKWRFAPDAMDKFNDEDKFLDRHLNDTRYMSRIAKEYLQYICKSVWVIPGQLTKLLRDKWGVNLQYLLNQGDNIKDRGDHRHHAVDAFVVACTSRSTLQKISAAAENTAKQERLINDMPQPTTNFEPAGRYRLTELLDKMIVSYKPDHKDARSAIRKGSTATPLHNETGWGFLKDIDDQYALFSVRKPVDSLCNDSMSKNIEKILSPSIKQTLTNLSEGKNNADAKKAILDYCEQHNIRRIKIADKKTKNTMVPINDRSGNPYKWYELGGNYCAEIFCPQRPFCNGDCVNCQFKSKKTWQCEIISNFDAHKKDFQPRWRKQYPCAKMIMRLFIDDMVAYEDKGSLLFCKVKKMSGNRVYLREHTIAKEKSNELTWGASAPQLQLKNARHVAVDVLGRVKDPYSAKCRS
ncbi:MAG: type II CRISPR RNA-guided endonuclease Cas9 [Candidatus Auribacterota bacterium]|jgi:CRISPR-associated endonuclease Csn1|nr:type II CRISPR RNA-guided endonuclease Cas9 [Candidatus Auribacterota bacterium]